MKPRLARVGVLAAAASLLLAACDSPSGPAPARHATLTKVSGDNQNGPAGSRLSQPLVVQLKDPDGHAAAGANVTWSFRSGSGSGSTSTPTDASGLASYTPQFPPGGGTLTVTASAADADSVTFTAAAIGSSPPALAVTSPTSGDVVVNRVRVAFTCTYCSRAEVRLQRGGAATLVLTTTAAAVDTTFDVPAYTGNSVVDVQVDAYGTDPTGTPAHVSVTRSVYAPPAAPVNAIATVPGTALDYRGGRVLWLDASNTLKVRTVSSGADQTVASGVSPSYARLWSGGAFYAAGGHVFEWRGSGAAADLGAADGAPARVAVDGDWAVWSSGGNVQRRDLAGATTTTVAAASVYDVGPNGDVVYYAGGAAPGIYRYRGGAATLIYSLLSVPFAVSTDGLVVLWRVPEIGNQMSLYRLGAGGTATKVMTSYLCCSFDPAIHFAQNGGWVAAGYHDQLVMVAPDGTVQPHAAVHSHLNGEAVGPVVEDVSAAGDLVYLGDMTASILPQARMVLPAGAPAPLYVAPTTGRTYFIGRQLIVIDDGTVSGASF